MKSNKIVTFDYKLFKFCRAKKGKEKKKKENNHHMQNQRQTSHW